MEHDANCLELRRNLHNRLDSEIYPVYYRLQLEILSFEFFLKFI